MNADGTWFGYVSPWRSVVPEGWESVDRAARRQAERRSIATRDAEARRRSSRTSRRRPGLAFTHARVLDVEHGKWLADQTVVVVGDTIQSVGPSKTRQDPDGRRGRRSRRQGAVARADGTCTRTSATPTACSTSRRASRPCATSATIPTSSTTARSASTTARAVGPHVDPLRLHRGPRREGGVEQGHRRDRGRGQGGGRVLRQARLRGHQDLQLDEARAGARARQGSARARHDGDRPHPGAHARERGRAAPATTASSTSTCCSSTSSPTHDTDTRDDHALHARRRQGGELRPREQAGARLLQALEGAQAPSSIRRSARSRISSIGRAGQDHPRGSRPGRARCRCRSSAASCMGGLPLDGDKRTTYRASFDKLLEMVKRAARREDSRSSSAPTASRASCSTTRSRSSCARASRRPRRCACATIDAARAMKLDKKIGSIAKGKIADLVVVDGDPARAHRRHRRASSPR